MRIGKADLRACLITKFGFEEVEGAKHGAVALILAGKKVATARFSSSHNDLSNQIQTLIAREIRVNLPQLKKMYGCTISRDQYLEQMRQDGHLE